MSRAPLEEFANSNGHGRASAGLQPTSRQSNLIIETSSPNSMEDLRKKLISECKKQGKPYGYLFQDVVGGFTLTQVYTPNVFNIFPTEVYRIYADGRPDELVRAISRSSSWLRCRSRTWTWTSYEWAWSSPLTRMMAPELRASEGVTSELPLD
jgi:hypothetical protein